MSREYSASVYMDQGMVRLTYQSDYDPKFTIYVGSNEHGDKITLTPDRKEMQDLVKELQFILGMEKGQE